MQFSTQVCAQKASIHLKLLLTTLELVSKEVLYYGLFFSGTCRTGLLQGLNKLHEKFVLTRVIEILYSLFLRAVMKIIFINDRAFRFLQHFVRKSSRHAKRCNIASTTSRNMFDCIPKSSLYCKSVLNVT